jgi:hypothetical protein
VIARYCAGDAVVSAFRWDGTFVEEAYCFVGSSPAAQFEPGDAPRLVVGRDASLVIFTRGSQVRAANGDWLIRNEDGDFTAMRSGMFAATFTRVRDEAVG